MLRRLLLTTAVVLTAGATVPPAKAMSPADFVNNLDRQLQIVAENPSPEQRQAGFRKVFHKDFDVHRLGWFVLGRYSRIMTPQQQQEFIGLFENYVAATYSDRLTEYITAGSVPRIIGIRLEPDGMIVSAEFSRGSGPSSAGAVRVDWRLRKYHHKYKITDIIIDGLSMAANGRSELEGVAERNGGQPEAILAVMRQETANAVLRGLER
jgi:phospholipid transport system substrate-binding protein